MGPAGHVPAISQVGALSSVPPREGVGQVGARGGTERFRPVSLHRRRPQGAGQRCTAGVRDSRRVAFVMARTSAAGPDAEARARAAASLEVDWPRLYATVPYTRLPWYSPRPARWLVEAVSHGWVRPPGPILDIGCGAGSNALWLSRHGFRVTGIDLAPAAIAAAQRRASRSRSSAVFAQGSCLSLPYRNSAFGSALDSGCFHSLPIADRSRYAREVARLVRPAGSLLITWIAREETGEYGPPHRPSLEEVVSVLEPAFLFERTEFADKRSPSAWNARGHRLSRYTALLRRRRTAQPPPR